MAKKILIVDDEPDILRTVSYRLEKMGYDIITATNGEEGLESARKNKPDMIFLDINMPVMDGFEVCKKIKSDQDLKGIPVVFLTVSQAQAVAERADGFNADDHVIKPFEPEELIGKIKKFIG
ncbi:MAG: response regulator [Candidatus Omnitrophica bacterium]|nr:response regulator [Candidatus Omnitrophota bacterium]